MAGPIGPTGPGGGTQIITGAGVPDATVGVDGDFYIDTATDILYGPKALVGFDPAENIFPDVTPTAGSGGYMTGAELRFLVQGQIIGARFWRRADVATLTHQVLLFDNATQALLATSAPSVETAGFQGWVSVTFPTPIAVAANQHVVVAKNDPNLYFFTATPPASLHPTHAEIVSGPYGPIGSSFPPSTSPSTYLIDAIWQPISSSTWPVAVVGVPPGGAASTVLTKASATDFALGWTTVFTQMTQAAYDALGTKDPNKLYVVVG